MGSIGQKSAFSEHGHVAYQIKENHECSNIVAYILPADPIPTAHPYPDPRDWANSSKFTIFQNMVMLHITSKGIAKCSNMVATILHADPPPYLSPSPPWWGQ